MFTYDESTTDVIAVSGVVVRCNYLTGPGDLDKKLHITGKHRRPRGYTREGPLL